ncbi:MAG: DUF2029 domain-containing protein [Bacteroidetes bacterium]|nr:DUF2029 domain-containing protein [Bacteroidota bacterium]
MSSPQYHRSIYSNLNYVLIGSITCYILLLLAQIYHQTEIFPVNRHELGIDFRDFYNAALATKNGISPYSSDFFVTPPTAIAFITPLTRFPLDPATQLFFFGTILCVAFSIILSGKALATGVNKTSYLIACIVFISHPFLFLLDRGNIDALVLLSLVLGLFLMKKNRLLMAGLCFGTAISLKVYPVLLIIPLVIGRQYKCLAGCTITLALSILIFPHSWLEFVQLRLLTIGNSTDPNEVLTRFSSFRMYENGSLANFFFGSLYFLKSVFRPETILNNHLIFNFSNLVYAMLLLSLIVINFSKRVREKMKTMQAIVLYIPFMIAIPKLAYIYEYILLIPMYLILLGNRSIISNRKINLLMVTAFIAVNLNTIVLEKLFLTDRYHFIPGMGLLILMIGSIYVMQSIHHNENPANALT